MDPVVAVALEDVTARVNVRTGLTHPYDRALAVEAFELVWGSGYPLPRMEIESWALVNGWDHDGVRDLGEVIAGVVTGHRSPLLARHTWPHGTLERWQKRANP